MKRLRLTSATSVVLIMLCIMYFITYLDRVNVSTAAAGFGKEFGLSHTEIGLVFSAFAYPYLLFQVSGGWISDRFGAKRTLLFCGALWAVATLLTGFATGLASMLVARVLLGFGEGATFPASTSAMSRWVPRERRGFAQGITHAAARIGNAVAPAIVVIAMTMWGWRSSFYACGVLSLIWVAVWSFTFSERPSEHRRITEAELAKLPPPAPKGGKVPWGPLIRRMAPVTIVYFCYGWTLWLFLSWIPQYFLHSQHLDLRHSAGFASAVFFAGVVGDTLGGTITDWLFKRTRNLNRARSLMVSVCMLMALLSLLPLMFTHNLLISVACLSSGFFFCEMTIGPMWSIPMDIAPKYAGTASGLMNTGSALAAIISPVVGGFVIDQTHNWQLPFLGSIVLMGCGVVLAFRMRPGDRFEAGELNESVATSQQRAA